MSDEQQSNVNSQQEQEDDEENSQEEDQDDDDEEEEGSGDEDEDEDESGDDDNDDDDEQQSGSGDDDDNSDQQSHSKQQSTDKNLPTFKIANNQPQQFKFTSLLSEISNLSCSVDNFIGTLHTSPLSNIPRRSYTNNYTTTQEKYYQPLIEQIQQQQQQQSRVVIMKDCDAQVDMKPQIIIQPTKTIKQEPVIQAKPYKISTQSEKFLSQLYQQNKKLKRWQVNPSHPMNSYMTSFTASNNNGFANSSKGFYNNKDRFERKQYQKGIFNVDERNKEIDQAIMMLKKQEDNEY